MKIIIQILFATFLVFPTYAAQKTITVGTSGTPASLDTNFSNAQDNFNELYTGRFNVKDYGAIGNGIADDSEGIQAALDAAYAVKGAVYMPSGVYYCTKSLIVPSYVKIYGDGIGKTIIRNPATVTPGSTTTSVNTVCATIGSAGATHVEFSGFTIDHQTNNTNSNGIVLVPDTFNCSDEPTADKTPTTYTYIHDIEVLGYDTHQYLIWNFFAKHTRILNNMVDGGVTVNTPASSQDGIEVYGGEDVLVFGNTITNIGSTALWTFSSENEPSQRKSIRFENNHIDGARYGIGGFNESPAYQIHYKNNIILNCYMVGIHFVSSGVVMEDIQFSGNSLSNIGDVGINLSGGLLADNVSVFDNTISNVYGSGSRGIQLVNYKNASVRNNTINGAETGIFITSSSVASGKTDISLNRVYNTQKNAISLYDTNYTNLFGNTLRNYNLENGSNYGIYQTAGKWTTVRNNIFLFGGSSETEAVNIVPGWGSTNSTLSDNVLEYIPALEPFIDGDAT